MNGYRIYGIAAGKADFHGNTGCGGAAPDAGGGGLVNRLMKKLVDRHRKTNSSIATVLGFVRYIAVAAVYFAGGMVIVGAIPVLSSAVRTLLATGGVIAVVAGLAAQEPSARGQRRDDPRIQAV